MVRIPRIVLTNALVIGVTVTAISQEVQTRSITGDAFGKARPASQAGGASGAAKAPVRPTNKPAPKPSYVFVRQETNRVKWSSTPRPKQTAKVLPGKEKVSEIGLTVWRLRPPAVNETGFALLPVLDNGVRRMWLPERVSATSVFRAGDRIRLAVESPSAGHLYVLNSEIYADGTLGPPHLLFPYPANQLNRIAPGMLVDFPDQTEDYPYFIVDPKKGNHVGELLAIVVAENKLDLKVDADGKVLNIGDVIDPEASFEAELYDRPDDTDKFFTKAESEAGCGSRSRQLERVKSTGNCTTATRQLTREEPRPQSIYRVKSSAGQPAVVFVKLKAE